MAWMRGQVGPHMSTAERLTLAEAVATQVTRDIFVGRASARVGQLRACDDRCSLEKELHSARAGEISSRLLTPAQCLHKAR